MAVEIMGPADRRANSVLPEELAKPYKTIMDFLVAHPGNECPEGLSQVDCVIIAGSSRIEVAMYAGLHTQNLRPETLVVCSGNRGGKTADWPATEAETFRDIFQDWNQHRLMRVEIEPEARNCDQNYLASIDLATEVVGSPLGKVALFCPKYVQRRFAYLNEIHRKADELIPFSPPLPPLNSYEWMSKLFSAITGEVDNKLSWMQATYPDKVTPIPEEVLEASKSLQEKGFLPVPVRTLNSQDLKVK